MRKIGVNLPGPRFSMFEPENGLQLFRQLGFDCFFSGVVPSWMERIADTASRNDLCWESIHAPFGHMNDIWQPTEDGEKMLQEILDSANECVRYNVPILVVHLSSGENAPCVNDIGHSRFDRLVDFAVKNNITIAFENQRKLANLAFVLEVYDKVDNVRFCWDVGHEACFTPGREYMPLFGKKLAYTHIHDNHCIYNSDEHMIPFDGCIDYERTVELLRRFDYKGSLTLEVMPKHELYKSMTPEAYFTRARAAVERLRTMLDEKGE